MTRRAAVKPDVSSQQISQYAGDLQEIVGTMRAGVSESASDLVTEAEPPASKPKSKKAA